MKALIIEDEIYNFRSLQRQLQKLCPGIEVEDPVTSVADMREILSRPNDYDAIFCDIRLDDGLCFEALSHIDLAVPLIFTTAYDEFALQAFEAGGIAYLLKPIQDDALRKALSKVVRMEANKLLSEDLLEHYGLSAFAQPASLLTVCKADGEKYVAAADFAYFFFDGNRVEGFFPDGTSEMLRYPTLDTLSKNLDTANFFRVNRQYVVNRSYIYMLHNSLRQTKELEMKDASRQRIKVSKAMVPKLRAWLEA